MPKRGTPVKDYATERVDGRTPDVSGMSTLAIMRAMNSGDATVPTAVRRSIRQICRAAEIISSTVNSGGRVFYLGAGTGGRIALQDAAEVPPTFGFSTSTFQAIIAGGLRAGRKALENAEDDTSEAARELKKRGIRGKDAVVGITASGRTPFVLSGLDFAASEGCKTICITSNGNSPVARLTDVAIIVETGPEIIAGSTRLKAGTAQKLVLNMLSTYAGIRAGRVIGNRMVGMKPTNEKLRGRAVSIVADLAGCSRSKAKDTLVRCSYDIRKALDLLRRE